MATTLTAIEDALAELTDIELRALIAATHEAPPVAPHLLAWIETACDWELNRRSGRHYPLPTREAAKDETEDAVCIDAMRATLAASNSAPPVLQFFDVVLKLLTGKGRKP